MKTYRSMTAAAVIGAAGAIGALSIGSALGQPATQPGQRPTTPPGQPTTQPGQRPTTPGMGGANERLFALEGAGAERQIQQLAQKLNQIEQQMQRTNQQLSQQVNQLDQMEGEQKVDAIGSVLESIVNEHEQLHTYLTELRGALTGPTSSTGATPGQPSRPGQPGQPGQSDQPNRPGQPGQSPR